MSASAGRLQHAVSRPRPVEPGCRPAAGSVTVDCDTCEVRGTGCGDCVVALLLGPPDEVLTLDRGQTRALDVLAVSGLVPPLRHRHRGPAAAGGDR